MGWLYVHASLSFPEQKQKCATAQLLTPKTSTLGLFATDLKTGFQEILLWAKQIFLTYTL